MANIFDNPAFQFLQRPSMDDFLKRCQQRFNRFGLSDADINDAIKSACDFFNIPMPRMIQDLTNAQNGQTMFMNWDRGSYYDDVLCFNMSIEKVAMGLLLTNGSPSHPEGTLRAMFIRHGRYVAPEMHRRGIPLTI